MPTLRPPCFHDKRKACYRRGRAHPWPGRIRTCWTTHKVSWSHLHPPIPFDPQGLVALFYLSLRAKMPFVLPILLSFELPARGLRIEVTAGQHGRQGVISPRASDEDIAHLVNLNLTSCLTRPAHEQVS